LVNFSLPKVLKNNDSPQVTLAGNKFHVLIHGVARSFDSLPEAGFEADAEAADGAILNFLEEGGRKLNLENDRARPFDYYLEKGLSIPCSAYEINSVFTILATTGAEQGAAIDIEMDGPADVAGAINVLWQFPGNSLPDMLGIGSNLNKQLGTLHRSRKGEHAAFTKYSVTTFPRA